MRAALLALFAFGLPAQAQVLTTSQQTDAYVTPAVMERRINDRALEIQRTYPAGTTAARTIQINVSPAASAAENTAMGGNALVLLSVVTHKSEELPLQRAFFRLASGDEAPLKLLGRSRQPITPDSAAHLLYGPYREDSFYLMPVHLLVEEGTVLADFTTNRTDFRIFQFPIDAPDYWKPDVLSGQSPDPATLASVFARDFPGYPPLSAAN